MTASTHRSLLRKQGNDIILRSRSLLTFSKAIPSSGLCVPQKEATLLSLSEILADVQARKVGLLG